MKNAEWLFFDIGSTLVDESKAYEHRIIETIKNTDITYEEFYEIMIMYYKQNKKGDKEAVKHFGLTKTKWYTEDEFLYPETKHTLEKLYQQYKIGIIANQEYGCKERLKNFGILQYIDLVVSSEEGICKPDLLIFNLALERANCKADKAIMNGDRLDNDIEPANILGMKTIWVKQGFSQYSTPEKETELPTVTVDSIEEILKYL